MTYGGFPTKAEYDAWIQANVKGAREAVNARAGLKSSGKGVVVPTGAESLKTIAGKQKGCPRALIDEVFEEMAGFEAKELWDAIINVKAAIIWDMNAEGSQGVRFGNRKKHLVRIHNRLAFWRLEFRIRHDLAFAELDIDFADEHEAKDLAYMIMIMLMPYYEKKLDLDDINLMRPAIFCKALEDRWGAG